LPNYSVAKAAQSDLRAIARYTVEKWGVNQAVRYARGLQDCLQILAENSEMGRACDVISPGLHRHEQGKHVVFYRLRPGGIRIVRVLHQQMIPDKAHFDQ
jgi:toxin ParE1/3/4